ncbi:MAG: sulfite exporter TauE/SafE family protein [Sphingomonadaceae bacterium]
MFDVSAINWQDVWPFIAVGFAAQLVDGALGMAFGVIATTALLLLGIPPALATSYVHVIKTFTGAASGVSHILHRNVDWLLFLRLSVAGVAGGVGGALLLSHLHLADANFARPFVFAYLVLIGLFILWRGIGYKIARERRARVVEPIAAVGGFLDATGGGGWGPVVTSNLLLQGNNPRMTVGTVNSAEFVLAVAVTITYLLSLGIKDLTAPVIGLLIGGVAAAPLGSLLTRHIPARQMMIIVGILLTAISLFGLYRVLVP